jgi:SAM-dependent methyltransferase
MKAMSKNAPGHTRATRGHGLLEPWLARLRARLANRLIPHELRSGRILDIGCGSYPYFLAHTEFSEKFAVEQFDLQEVPADIVLHTLDLNAHPSLPFQSGFFSAVTLLAVIEHLDPDSLVTLLRETYRVLIPEGVLLLTTPAAWAFRLLDLMASLNLVSREEIDEHCFAYTPPLLGWYFGAAGFSMRRLRFGAFELGLNLWAIARR